MPELKKIAIIGPESSGKTTLARALAEHYSTVWIPEFAREYLADLDGDYMMSDLTNIALGQLAMERSLEGLAQKYLFSDTDMTTIKIWSQDKFGAVDPQIEKLFTEQDYAHYFLCSPDMEWEEDALREDPERRDEIFEMYKAELDRVGRRFTIVEGELERRLEDVVAELGE